MSPQRPLLASAALAALLVCAQPARAEAPYRTHETPLFTLQLPETFSLVKSAGESWTYQSKNGHYYLRITAHPSTKKPLKVLGARILERFLEKSQDVRMLEKKTMRDDDRDIFYAVFKSTRTHGEKRRYLTMRMLTRSNTLGKLFNLTLSVSGERLGEFGNLVEHVIGSLTFLPAK